MPKIPFEELDIANEMVIQKRQKCRDWKKKENTGLDTETYEGYVKLICSDDGSFKEVSSFMDIIRFLTQKKFLNKFNWFYNIKFDFESIIKYLDYDELVTLYQERRIIKNSFTIVYLDKKFFAVLDKNGHNYYFYDLFNFLDTSLNKASKKFLNDKKLDVIDSSRLNIDLDYWKTEKENIIKYCIYDANLTKRLADYFWNLLYQNMNYAPKRPFSKGKLSEEYFLKMCYIPTINLLANDKRFGINVLNYAYNSYYGGRFELLKRGYFPKVYTYDIKSAYPAQIANLIDFTKGKWEITHNKNPTSDAYEGFYQVKINCQESYFSPIVKKEHELSLYPNGRFEQYLCKSEIDFIKENFENIEITIKTGYEFFEKDLIYPYKKEVEYLYRWKETEQDEDIKYVVKIILNSLYGKTIQVVGFSDKKNVRTGKLFNPIYASLITAKTRIKLLELACQKPESIIMFSTDGVHSDKPLKVGSKPNLGDFATDFSGEGVYLMSDVYNLWNDKKTKNKLRGFSLAMEKDIDSDGILLKDILENMNTPEYKYTTKRPFHLGECILHNKKRDVKRDLNVFGDVEKSINVNGDKKRVWDKDFINGKECLKHNILSVPVVVF